MRYGDRDDKGEREREGRGRGKEKVRRKEGEGVCVCVWKREKCKDRRYAKKRVEMERDEEEWLQLPFGSFMLATRLRNVNKSGFNLYRLQLQDKCAMLYSWVKSDYIRGIPMEKDCVESTVQVGTGIKNLIAFLSKHLKTYLLCCRTIIWVRKPDQYCQFLKYRQPAYLSRNAKFDTLGFTWDWTSDNRFLYNN